MSNQLTFEAFESGTLEQTAKALSPDSSDEARGHLEDKYRQIMGTADWLDRKLISFQANKDSPFYRWFKYREGFAGAMVRRLLICIHPKPGKLLDPFAGAGSALFAARELGWKSTGIELLPPGQLAIKARLASERVNPAEFEAAVKIIKSGVWKRSRQKCSFQHLRITQNAFPELSESQLNSYLSWIEQDHFSPRTSRLLRFAAFCILEDISFTRKDGQYLRWDSRSGRALGKGFHKGPIIAFETALLQQLNLMLDDISRRSELFPQDSGKKKHAIDLRKGSCLELLLELKANSFDCIFTSPPYCNRYDYTRTYALELAFLGCQEEEVKSLRQGMLFCTVENKEKIGLERMHRGLFQALHNRAVTAFREQAALGEVLDRLELHRSLNLLNNHAIVKLVKNYFLEMSLVLSSCSRVLKAGGHFVMINDNVRYAGEIVPVDLILSDFAERFGMKPIHAWKLGRGKGNSSQQMGSHGRSELRKSVCVWQKQ